jgi:hypothetical protein
MWRLASNGPHEDSVVAVVKECEGMDAKECGWAGRGRDKLAKKQNIFTHGGDSTDPRRSTTSTSLD